MNHKDKEAAGAFQLQELELSDLDYHLPARLIAQEPCKERASSRLMLLDRNSQELKHKHFFDLPAFLKPQDCLVLNNTRVIPARIIARRASGGSVEILLLKPEAGQAGLWQAMASPMRKLKEGDLLKVEYSGKETLIKVSGFFQAEDGQRRVFLDLGQQKEAYELLSQIGQAPLPPYIRRRRQESKHDEGAETASFSDAEDLQRYQTVFAMVPGAVAAPTAGLHFSNELLSKIKQMGVSVEFITLHVGPGTFKPLSSSIEDHSIESEEFQISAEAAETIRKTKSAGGRVIAVGTTSCRALETAGSEKGTIQAISSGASRLYIKPGYKFRVIDGLITNFHLPRSSLLLLVSAFAGHQRIMTAYAEAISNGYRFYSYGDAMFIF